MLGAVPDYPSSRIDWPPRQGGNLGELSGLLRRVGCISLCDFIGKPTRTVLTISIQFWRTVQIWFVFDNIVDGNRTELGVHLHFSDRTASGKLPMLI